MRTLRGLAPLVLSLLSLLSLLGATSTSVPAAGLKPSTYSGLFSRANVVAAGTVTGVSAGLFSEGRKAQIKVEGLYKGRLPRNAIEVGWKDEEHKETCYRDGAQVVLFLIMGKDSSYSQAAPGISCWQVEKVSFATNRPSPAVAYEFPLDLVSGIPKGATRETEVVEKSLNFQVPKRKRWILVDALLPQMKPWKPARKRSKNEK